MQVFLKNSKANRVYVCGRIIDANENGSFELTAEEFALNQNVFEPADESYGEVVKPLKETAQDEPSVEETEKETTQDEPVVEKPKRKSTKKS